MSNIFFYTKGTYNSPFGANFTPQKWVEILKIAHLSVLEGYKEAKGIAKANPSIFADGTLSSTLLNKAIIVAFMEKTYGEHNWKNRLKFFRAQRMIYCLVDREFFICFKAVGKEGLIEGMNTKRFADMLMDGQISLNKTMQEELAKLSLAKMPPLLFVGFTKSQNSIADIKFQHYYGGGLSFDFEFQPGVILGQSKFNSKNNGESGSDSVAV